MVIQSKPIALLLMGAAFFPTQRALAQPTDKPIAPGVAPPTAREGGTRIADVIALALKHNERARSPQERVRAAEAAVVKARASLIPSLSATAGETLRPAPPTGSDTTSFAATATLTAPIFAPSAYPLLSQSKHSAEAERHQAGEDRRVLAYDVARAFLTALTANEVKLAADQRFVRAEANLANARARAAAGFASSNDVTRSEIELASAKREVESAIGTVARAYIQLSFLTVVSVSGPLVEPTQTTRAAELRGVSDVKALCATARLRRLDVRSSREKVEAAEQSAKEPMWRLAPTIAFQGQVRATAPTGSSGRVDDETLQLTASWPIFDGGSRYADRESRLASLKIAMLDQSLLERRVEADVRVALANLQAAQGVYQAASSAVDSARRNTQETEVLYKQGLARAIELVDANAKRFDAEVALATARLSMEQAYLELRFATGDGPLDTSEGGAR